MSTDVLVVSSWRDAAIQHEFNLATKLEAEGYTVHFLSPRCSDEISRELNGEFFSLADGTHTEGPTISELEAEYGVPSGRHLYFTGMKYFALSRSQAVERTRRFAHVFQQLFEATEIDYLFQGRGGEIHRLLAHYFVKNAGGTSIWGEFSPFDDRVAFSTRLNGTWDNYETIPDSEIPADDRAEVDEYIESFRSAQKVYSHGTEASDGFSITDTVGNLLSALDTIRIGTTPTNPYRYAARKIRTRVNGRINRSLLPSGGESRQLCQRTQYLYFPLQYPIESRLTVFSPEFFDQSYLIEYLSRILPQGLKLFVKQHPNHPGQQSPLWIRRVQENDQVELLDPSFNSHEVISNAEGVVVTNNTVGFETLFYNTPLVVLGRAFYEDVPSAVHVSELSTLPEQLAGAIDQPITESDVRSAIYSLQEATYPLGPTETHDERDSATAAAFCSFVDTYG